MSLPLRQKQEHTLFYSSLCPFSRKIRLQLAEKKMVWRAFEERLFAPSEKLCSLNPEGTTPVLVMGGDVLVKSYAIQEYIEEMVPDFSLLGAKPSARGEVRRLLSWFDEKLFYEVTQKFLSEKVIKRSRGNCEPDASVLRQARQALYEHMDYIGWLFDRRSWLAGSQLTLADLAAAAQLSCIDYLGDVAWDKYPSTKEWFVKMKSRPSFRPLLMESFVGIIPSRTYRMLDF